MGYLTEKYETAYDQKMEAVVLEDCIMQKGKPAAAGSKILEGFISPFDACVVEKLNENVIPIAGRCSMDEFGIDSLIPDEGDPERVLGAVGAVADKIAPYALCSDLFGKARRQAPVRGVCHIHPTYGTVSRYGLIPSASSMDQIGVVCGDLAGGFRLLSVIAGGDKRDGAMYPEASYRYTPFEGKIRLAIPENVWIKACEGERAAVERLKKRFETSTIELRYFELYRQVMYILSCAEICNNTNRYDGIKFGYRAEKYGNVSELYVNTRSGGLGRDAKLASIMGSMVLSKNYYSPYYEKAMKIRRLIKESLNFEGYDVIALPARQEGGPYEQSALYAPAVLAGLPCVSFPLGDGGIQLIAKAGNENVLFGAWEAAKC